MAHAETAEPPRTLATRLFDAAPVPPLLLGVGLGALGIGLIGGVAWLSGDLAAVAAKSGPWWQNRDVRLALLIPLLAAAAVTATRYHVVGTRENLAAVARLAGWREEEIDPDRLPGSRLREQRVGILGALVVPAIALLVDRDPRIYFGSEYWSVTKACYWALGLLAARAGAILSHRALRDARHFSRLALRLPAVDLLEPGKLAPFARQGLRSAVPGLLMITFISLNALDQGFLWAVGAMGSLGLVCVAAAFAIPVGGVRSRVRRAKGEELARVHAAIRGEPGALRGSAIEAFERPALADLLAYRDRVAAVHEWPVDLPTLSRVALYVAIPLLSWVGGALVDHALDLILE